MVRYQKVLACKFVFIIKTNVYKILKTVGVGVTVMVDCGSKSRRGTLPEQT